MRRAKLGLSLRTALRVAIADRCDHASSSCTSKRTVFGYRLGNCFQLFAKLSSLFIIGDLLSRSAKIVLRSRDLDARGCRRYALSYFVSL